MEEILKEEIESKIYSVIKFHLKLKLGHYWKQSSNKTMTIFFSKENLEISQLKITSIGIPILKQTHTKIDLLPGLLYIIEKLDMITLSNKELNQVSHGKSIIVEHDPGFYLIPDKFNRILCLGKLENHKFIPIIDKGLYLRSEKMW